MIDVKEHDYVCPVCGQPAEVEVSPMDFPAMGTITCAHCGLSEEVAAVKEEDERLGAVRIAINREREAVLFYRDAAAKTPSAKAKDMFKELQDFELHHYKKLLHLYHSLQRGGTYVSYKGKGTLEPKKRIEERLAPAEGMKDDIDALKVAIDKETEAIEFYEEMAKKAGDELGTSMFRRLAEEEVIHRRILNDQLYSLGTQGTWMWGE